MPNTIIDYFDRPQRIFFASLLGKTEDLSKILEDLEQKSFINHPVNTQGNHTPLFFACYGAGNVETVRLLLQNGAEPLARDNVNRNILHIAANTADPEILNELLSIPGLGALVNAASEITGQTPFHALCYPGSGASADNKGGKANIKESLNILLSKFMEQEAAINALLNVKDKNGLTPLMLAKYFNMTEVLEVVSEKFPSINLADINLPENIQNILEGDFYGRTKLLEAAFVGNNEMVMSELVQGKDPMQVNVQSDRNALQLSCCGMGNGETVKLILTDPHTNPVAQDHSGRTALHFAANTGRKDTVEELLKNELMRSNVNILDLNGRTALHALAMAGSRTKPAEGQTISEREQAIELLFANGINYDLVDVNGDTARMIAESRGNAVVVKKIDDLIAAMRPSVLLAYTAATQTSTDAAGEPASSSSSVEATSSVEKVVEESVKNVKPGSPTP